MIVDGRVLVPLRKLFETFNAEVDWNQETKTATVLTDDKKTKLGITIGASTVYVNGKAINLDVPAQIINGMTPVPLRFVAENFGFTVKWSAEEKLVTIEDESTKNATS